MQFGLQAEHEVAGIGAFRLLASFAAPFDVIGDGVGEGGAQIDQCAALEGQHVAGVGDLAMEQVSRFVQFHRHKFLHTPEQDIHWLRESSGSATPPPITFFQIGRAHV